MVKKEIAKRLAMFAILMGAKQNILFHSPDYIMEKFVQCISVEYPEKGLDQINRNIFEKWKQKWGVE